MDRVLVGVDGSPAALDALSWAAAVAARAGLSLIAARAFVPDQAELPPDRYDALKGDAARELDGWCASVAAEGPGPRTLVVDGEPPDALLGAARDERADLLVVGTRGAGGFAHLHLGSVAHHLAHHTTLPLAIVPRTAAGAGVERLVVGTDGSPGSSAAVRLSAELAKALGVPATAVFAFEPFAEWVPEKDPRSWHHHAESEVRGWAGPIESAGVTLDVVVDREIHPVTALARALDEHPASVAVVGTRGLGGFTGLRLGRVPIQLVHHTGAAVIIVPPAGDE